MFAAACALSTAAADFSSRLSVGNWSGGAWTDPATKVYRNCGMSIGFGDGSRFTYIIPANLDGYMLYIDSRVTAPVQTRYDVKVRFGEGPLLTLAGRVIQPGIVRVASPALPDNYDRMRLSGKVSISFPGRSAILPIDGFARALPLVADCANRERLAMESAPATLGEDGHMEATLAGLALAEGAGLGPYAVPTDDGRPAGLEDASSVVIFPAIIGPNGPARVTMVARHAPATRGTTAAEQRATLVERIRSNHSGAIFADLPEVQDRPDSSCVSASTGSTYREDCLVRRKAGGFFHIGVMVPATARGSGEVVGAALRFALPRILP
jgi:hypothetical protein